MKPYGYNLDGKTYQDLKHTLSSVQPKGIKQQKLVPLHSLQTFNKSALSQYNVNEIKKEIANLKTLNKWGTAGKVMNPDLKQKLETWETDHNRYLKSNAIGTTQDTFGNTFK